jgi:hypothetical protein
MNPGHRDMERVAVEHEIPRRAQRTSGAIALGPQLGAGAGDRPGGSRFDGERTNGVVPCVSDVQHVAGED